MKEARLKGVTRSHTKSMWGLSSVHHCIFSILATHLVFNSSSPPRPVGFHWIRPPAAPELHQPELGGWGGVGGVAAESL